MPQQQTQQNLILNNGISGIPAMSLGLYNYSIDPYLIDPSNQFKTISYKAIIDIEKSNLKKVKEIKESQLAHKHYSNITKIDDYKLYEGGDYVVYSMKANDLDDAINDYKIACDCGGSNYPINKDLLKSNDIAKIRMETKRINNSIESKKKTTEIVDMIQISSGFISKLNLPVPFMKKKVSLTGFDSNLRKQINNSTVKYDIHKALKNAGIGSSGKVSSVVWKMITALTRTILENLQK